MRVSTVGENPGGRVRVHEQDQRGAERQGGVRPFSSGQYDDAAERLAGRWANRPALGHK
jgi:hypothetical protein